MTRELPLSRLEAARYAGMSYTTLFRLEKEGQGPKAILVGGTVRKHRRYRIEDLDAWVKGRLI